MSRDILDPERGSVLRYVGRYLLKASALANRIHTAFPL